MINRFFFFMLFMVSLAVKAQPKVQWDVSIGGNNIDFTTDIKILNDGNYAVMSQTHSTDIPGHHGVRDVYVEKTSSIDGSKIWGRCLGGSGTDLGVMSLVLQDSNILMIGNTLATVSDGDINGPNGSQDFWLAKLDQSDGTLLWSACYGGTASETSQWAIQHSDGSIYVVGSTTTTDGSGDVPNHFGGLADVWLIKVDQTTGALIWAENYGGSQTTSVTGRDYGRRIIESTDGQIVFTATTNSQNTGQVSGIHPGTAPLFLEEDVWVVKVDTFDGSILTQRCLGGNLKEGSGFILNAPDGNLLLANSTNSNVGGDITRRLGSIDNDLFITKIDLQTLDTIWTKVTGGDGVDGTYNFFYHDMDDALWVFANIYEPTVTDVSNHKGHWDPCIFKLNEETGDIIWAKSYGDSLADNFPAGTLIPSADIDCNGDVLLQYVTLDTGINEFKLEPNFPGQTAATSVILKITTDGELIWSKTISSAGPNADNATCVLQHPNGDMLVGFSDQTHIANDPGGDKTSPALGNRDVWLVNLDYDTTSFEYEVCFDNEVLFAVTDGDMNRAPEAEYRWIFGDTAALGTDTGSGASLPYQYPDEGNYDIVLTKQKDCKLDTLYKAVTVTEINKIELLDSCVEENSSIDVSAPYQGTYAWSTGAISNQISITTEGTYSIFITIDGLGCEYRDTFEIALCPMDSILDDTLPDTLEETIFLPNVFRPTSTVNNRFGIANSLVDSAHTLQIFDRWGNIVFDNQGLWDGTYEGRICPEGVYLYKLIAKEERFIGSLTLLR